MSHETDVSSSCKIGEKKRWCPRMFMWTTSWVTCVFHQRHCYNARSCLAGSTYVSESRSGDQLCPSCFPIFFESLFLIKRSCPIQSFRHNGITESFEDFVHQHPTWNMGQLPNQATTLRMVLEMCISRGIPVAFATWTHKTDGSDFKRIKLWRAGFAGKFVTPCLQIHHELLLFIGAISSSYTIVSTAIFF